MVLEEKELSSRTVFDGKVVHLCVDQVELPNGKAATREYVKHVGAVCVVALTDKNEVILERQFRYPFHRELIEIPAGKLDSKSEDPLQAALRELREETGASCRELIPLGEMLPSPAILRERISLFLARGLSFGETSLDEDEFLSAVRIPLEELYRLCTIGIDILGGHRKDFPVSSTLKSREYGAWGLPLVTSSPVDFMGNDCPWQHLVPYDDSPVDMDAMLRYYHETYGDADTVAKAIRDFSYGKCHMPITMEPVVRWLLEEQA